MKNKLVAWIGHDGNPEDKCCLIWASKEKKALKLLKKHQNFNSEDVQVARIPGADFLLNDRVKPGLELENDKKALYHYLVGF